MTYRYRAAGAKLRFGGAALLGVAGLLMFAPTAPRPQSAGQKTPQKRWGRAHYRAPQGWAESVSGTTRIFLAPGEDGKKAMIVLVQGPVFPGDFRSAFEKSLQNVTQGKKVVQQTEMQSTKSTEGYEVLSQAVVTEDDNGGRMLAMYVAINADRHIWLAGFVGTTTEAAQKYGPALQQFLADLDIDHSPAGADLDAISSGPIPERPANGTGRASAPTPGDAPSGGAVAATRRVAGHVRGRVYDSQGRPFRMAGITPHIHVFGTTAAGERTTYDMEADENGLYDMPVPHGIYMVTCWADMPVGGKMVKVDFDRIDQKQATLTDDSTPGIVRDFMLKIGDSAHGDASGVQRGFHGGGIYITDGANYKEPYFGAFDRKYPAGSRVVVTLTPRTRLIDGSVGKTLTLSCEFGEMKSGAGRAGIPLAVYTVTAKMVLPDGQERRLRVATLPNLQYADSMEVRFGPDPDDHDGRAAIPNVFVID